MKQESNQNDSLTKIARLFGNHMVPIYFHLEKDVNVKHIVISAFVITVNGAWFLVTAGHCLNDLDEVIKNGYQIKQAKLIDFMGENFSNCQPIPFDYQNAEHFAIDKNGYDFGIIHLIPHYKRLLEANGIIPLDQRTWENQPPKPVIFFLLGIPANLTDIQGRVKSIEARIYTVLECQIPPPDFEPVSAPTFYGNVILPEHCDIAGMSGGPIIGVTQNENGEWRYWIYAIQSRWLKNKKMIAACLIKTFTAYMQDELNRLSIKTEL